MNKITHQVPYLPAGRELYEVPPGDVFMARALAEVEKMERENPEANRAAASVIVKNGVTVSVGRNRSTHPTFCPRKALSSSTGQEYELCPKYCHSDNHSESAAIRIACEAGIDVIGADLYLAGHWWACQPCWDAMIAAGIKNVFVAEGAKELYDDAARKDNPLAGKLKSPIRIYLSGDNLAEATAALTKVNFQIVDSLLDSEIVMLLPGASAENPKTKNLTVYDYRKLSRYQEAIAVFAEDLAL